MIHLAGTPGPSRRYPEGQETVNPFDIGIGYGPGDTAVRGDVTVGTVRGRRR
jgi:hypothetical protein